VDGLGPVSSALLVDQSPDVTLLIDVEGRLRYANRAAEESLGWAADQWVGRSVLDLVHPDDAMLVLSSVDAVQGKPLGTPIEIRVRDSRGRWRWLEVIGRDCTHDPVIAGIVCTARDLTQRRMWEVAASNVARFQQVVQHASAIVMLLDTDGSVISVNGAFTRLLGHDPSVVVGRELVDFVARDEQRIFTDAVAEATGLRLVSVEVSLTTTAGEATPVRLEIVNLREDPVIEGTIVTGHDVSELHAARRQLEYLAGHDPLTGLPNRSLLNERLTQLLKARRPMALLYVDLDRFKPVNDQFGHDVGDELLRRVAQRLTAATDASDLVARIGGDEFVVVVVGISDRATAHTVARRLARRLAEPFQLETGTVRIGASIGVAIATRDSTAQSLLVEADRAMYHAKSA
jgi:diguanylate cyclase (GGDEF)-like protein/PAS domain S-box-containing protein